MNDDLLKMFLSAGEVKKREDIPPDFFDPSVRYALIGNSLTMLAHNGVPNALSIDPATGMKIVPTTTSGLGYPALSQDGRCIIFSGSGTEPAPPAVGNTFLTSLFSINLPITIDFYAYTKSTNFWAVLNYFTQNGSDGRKIQQGTESGGNRFNFNNGAGYSATIQAPNTLATQGKWAHLAYVWTTTGARIYVNGAKVAESVGNTAGTFYLNNLCLGAKGSSGIYGWNGALYNYRVSNIERYTNDFAVELNDMPIPT